MIKVAVCGALGKMGREVVEAVKNCELTELSCKKLILPEMILTNLLKKLTRAAI